MAREWQTFVRRFNDMQDGRVELFIKDLTPGPRKYDTKHVIAEISRSQTELPGADILWVRGESGLMAEAPMYIKIVEELPEWVAGRPHEDVLAAIANAQKTERTNE